jgi:hypothetical protein
MIEVKYGILPDKYFANYLDFLINQLYKSLCLKEENCDTLISYLQSLQCELIGSKELISAFKNDSRVISLLNKIQYLIATPEIEQKVFKKEIFSCISIVEKLQVKYFNKGGD